MDNKTLTELAEKFTRGIATEEEKEQLHEWYDTWQDDEEPVIISEGENAEQIRDIIFMNIQSKINATKTRKPKVLFIKRYWQRVAVAAVFIIAAGTGSYLYFKNDKGNLATVQNKTLHDKPDVLPGNNKAILTLANGQQIILDSNATGNIAKQGNAAIINLKGTLAYKTLNEKPGEVVFNTISTPRGGQYQLVLCDGSKVWLNSAASLRFPTAFAGKTREVELIGEGYFEIAHNASMPFKVKAGNVKVEVLGTHFNVMAYSDESSIKTTLLEGKVKVILTSSLNIQRSHFLSPGQQVQVKSNGEIKLIPNADIGATMAWKNGWFEFDQTDLETIMRQVSRWYDVDIAYEGKPAIEKFGGRMSKNLPLSSVLTMLESNGVRFRLEGKKLVVMP